MSEVKAPVTVEELDKLVGTLAELEEGKATIEAELKEKNKEISKLEGSIRAHLIELEREEYSSPLGNVSLKEEFQVKMPQSPEAKEQLWVWMKEKGIFERYATVHAVALKSLFKAERDLAIENGEDPMTFALPGMEPATIFEDVKFKPAKR